MNCRKRLYHLPIIRKAQIAQLALVEMQLKEGLFPTKGTVESLLDFKICQVPVAHVDSISLL